MNRIFSALTAAAILLSPVAVAAQRQGFSDSFTFLKAVKERDGAKASALIAAPGSTVINSRERENGDTGLHIVARNRDLNWLAFLLSKGAKRDLQNGEGDTPLAVAARIGWYEGVELLLGERAIVDLPNSRGETPLILAVQGRNVAMVRLLLSAGANPKRADSIAGYSALDYAKQDRRAGAIVKLLEAGPAKPAKEVQGPTL